MTPIQITRPQPPEIHTKKSVSSSIGLGMFLFSIVLFCASLFLGDYHISEASLTQAGNNIGAERAATLSNLAGKSYNSKFTALNEIETALKAADQNISEYDLGVAKFWILKTATVGVLRDHATGYLWLTLGLAIIGGLLFILPKFTGLPGIKNDHIYFLSATSRGAVGIVIGILFIGFYVLLYWVPWYIVEPVLFFDPLSQALRTQPADRWFVYGTMYTLVILVMGVRMFAKYRHSRYHLIRTASLMFFQAGFAFMIPTFLERLNRPSMDLKNAWPLNYTFFTDWNLSSLLSGGSIGTIFLIWGIILAVVVVPVMTYFYGKRWYCSWVCGCGGLAETMGDPFRQLSNKSLTAWRVERWLVHSVLIFAVVMTVMQIANFTSNGALFGNYTWRVNQAYSFWIGAAFAGVVGTGFYPFMGNRVWCRFGCPLAAILGIVQRFKSRFRITTNGGQCISCGNCSTYCEMGIDVRAYAQRGENIVRASCVGCGVCAAVCPRGVLRLENGPSGVRFQLPDMEAVN